jgi:hypothetical protein
MAKKKMPLYCVERSKSPGGLNGWSVLTRKGREVFFETSETEARNHCGWLNMRQKQQRGKR